MEVKARAFSYRAESLLLNVHFQQIKDITEYLLMKIFTIPCKRKGILEIEFVRKIFLRHIRLTLYLYIWILKGLKLNILNY